MKRYYVEIGNYETQDYIMQSKWFKTPRQAEKWYANNIDYVDFENYYVNIMVADFTDQYYDNILKYSYIDNEISNNLKTLYQKEQ